jgi:hypothetical protein
MTGRSGLGTLSSSGLQPVYSAHTTAVPLTFILSLPAAQFQRQGRATSLCGAPSTSPTLRILSSRTQPPAFGAWGEGSAFRFLLHFFRDGFFSRKPSIATPKHIVIPSGVCAARNPSSIPRMGTTAKQPWKPAPSRAANSAPPGTTSSAGNKSAPARRAERLACRHKS